MKIGYENQNGWVRIGEESFAVLSRRNDTLNRIQSLFEEPNTLNNVWFTPSLIFYYTKEWEKEYILVDVDLL